MADSTSVQEPKRALASLVDQRVTLSLETIDLCFAMALHLSALKTGAPSFREDVLSDVFVQVCDFAEPGAENPQKRATHAIQRLRDQRLLVRIDGTGIVKAGEFALTRLAVSIVEFFLADERLTRESLTILTRTLIANLAEVLAHARKAASPDEWLTNVIGPLRITVSELVGGIERRQRGLDVQQEEIRAQIAQLLDTDWFAAVDRCQELLDSTSATLRELHEILLRDAHELHALLQDVEQLATVANAVEATDAVQRAGDQIDRIVSWAEERQRAWSDYYQYVTRYLRDVVRLDPDRALSQRLREQLAHWPAAPFALMVAQAERHMGLRDVNALAERAAVTRPHSDREREIHEVDAVDEGVELARRIDELLRNGTGTLSALTSAITGDMPQGTRYLTAGRIVEIAAECADVASDRERPWVSAGGVLEIEEWLLRKRKARP